MTLMLHAGATEVAYDDLRAVATPPRTSSHVPVAHHEIVELMRYSLGFFGHEIVEEHHAVTEDGARYFGLLSLRSPDGEYTDTLGLRNSHDKKFPIGIAFAAASSFVTIWPSRPITLSGASIRPTPSGNYPASSLRSLSR